MWKEFKEFVMRGNVLDMAVGIIIGAAFSKIINSLVSDVLMPPLGRVLGGVDFSSLFINISGTPYNSLVEAQKAGAATINYGLFINTIINFLIVAFAVFLLIKGVNSLKRKQPPVPAATPTTRPCPHCFSSIPNQATRCAFCTSELGAVRV